MNEPVAELVSQNGQMALVEILCHPFDLPAGTKLYAGAQPEPVARITAGARLEWLCDHETAVRLMGAKLYAGAQPAVPQKPAAEVDMLAVCAALGFDPTNHHNAAKCPYCRPSHPVPAAPDAASGLGGTRPDRALVLYNGSTDEPYIDIDGADLWCNAEDFTSEAREKIKWMVSAANSVLTAALPAPSSLGSASCPDGLLPDGPVCPRCGVRRSPSGIGGGTWVHWPEVSEK